MDVDSSLLPATTTVRSSSSSGGCTDILGRSNTPSFSYFKDWKFNYGADLKAKTICRITRLLVFLIFFLFVEGKATSPAVSKVFESISGVNVIYRTRELEEQQVKREAARNNLQLQHKNSTRYMAGITMLLEDGGLLGMS
ncbi:glycosyltransferase-like At3g57200 isoform X2 [Citrus sinensis]|uniref:glycosyltransferase-like At3g57200 isoform X2 n=1 Tax=Citrus sinensis TaxID=2711 RepID=UPI002279826F|nr:glycosyltransferase-like At3g57200 isoform X2 [Citrus sinensis]